MQHSARREPSRPAPLRALRFADFHPSPQTHHTPGRGQPAGRDFPSGRNLQEHGKQPWLAGISRNNKTPHGLGRVFQTRERRKPHAVRIDKLNTRRAPGVAARARMDSRTLRPRRRGRRGRAEVPGQIIDENRRFLFRDRRSELNHPVHDVIPPVSRQMGCDHFLERMAELALGHDNFPGGAFGQPGFPFRGLRPAGRHGRARQQTGAGKKRQQANARCHPSRAAGVRRARFQSIWLELRHPSGFSEAAFLPATRP